MDLLILGIDGGDRRVIDAMEMPALAKMLAGMASLDPVEDLWSRGWAHVLSGQHGRETGAFYNKPKLDGTYGFTQAFGTRDYGMNEHVTPLWQLLCGSGFRIGFQNVPTTMPAPSVDGFLISGAGGGFSPEGGVPVEACMPPEALEIIDDAGGDWETRFLAAGIVDPDSFFGRVKETVDRRAQAFVALCKRYRPDIGFLVQKEAVVVQNLAMSEIQPILDGKTPSTAAQQLIGAFYRTLDASIQIVVEALQPDRLIVISDHGSESRLHSVNLNSLLEEHGYLRRDRGRRRTVAMIDRVRRFVPRSVRRSAVSRSQKLASLREPRADLDAERTMAFGARYVPGIYVNDERFGGRDGVPEALVEELVALVNDSPEAARVGLRAVPYRERFHGTRWEDLLPDVWVEHPDTVFFEEGGGFIEANSDYGPLLNLEHANRDLFTGIKGRHPLLHIDDRLREFAEEEDLSADLTAAYRIVQRSIT